MDCPKELSARDRLGATWLNGLVRFVRSLRLIQGPGVKLTRTPNGTIISVKRERKQPTEIVWPWTFKCTIGEDPTTHEETRTGGWYNARLQIGLNTNVTGKCGAEIGSQAQHQSDEIQGLDKTDDGTYYVEVDLVEETAELKIATGGNIPPNDFVHNKVNVYIGTVDDGIQTDGIFFVPCIYKRLD